VRHKDFWIFPEERAERHNHRAARRSELVGPGLHGVGPLAAPDGADESGRAAKFASGIGERQNRQPLDRFAPEVLIVVGKRKRFDAGLPQPPERLATKPPRAEQNQRAAARPDGAIERSAFPPLHRRRIFVEKFVDFGDEFALVDRPTPSSSKCDGPELEPSRQGGRS
jgi:hypothetical protein